MKRLRMILCLLSLCSLHIAAQTFNLRSPQGDITAKIFVDNGKLTYQVKHKEQLVLASSRMLWNVSQTILGESVKNVHLEKGKKVKNHFQVVGAHSIANVMYRTYTMNVTEMNGTSYCVEIRLYNDGFAFRYLTNVGNKAAIVDDGTTFCLPKLAQCWLQSNVKCYEAPYNEFQVGNLPLGKLAGPPVTVKYPSGVYAAITEGNLVNFGGMHLKVVSSDTFKSELEGETNLGGVVATPWRVVMIGDLNSLVNNDIVQDVSAPLDAVFMGDTSWIKPGNCVWSWLSGYKVTYENMIRFIDWAAELGIPYNLVDEGWSYWNDKDAGLDAWQMVKKMVDYGNSKGVKTLLWKAYPDRKGIEGIQSPERRRAFFKKCKEIGVVGLKIDFFDSENQTITKYYAETLKDAAEYGLIINFHGTNKPTGLNRTFPNELTREGIMGLEFGKSHVDQDVVFPYTRFLAGHADFTGMTFQKGRMGETSEAHQIAVSAIFTSPLRCYGGCPEDYLVHPARELFMSIPTVWDETLVLPPSEIGQCVVQAKRKGEDWFVFALNGEAPLEVNIPLVFLKKGNYSSLAAYDTDTEKCALTRGTQAAKSIITFRMSKGGGYVMRLKRQ